LWIDLKDDEEKTIRGSDPAIGLKVRSVEMVLNALAARGITEKPEPLAANTGLYAIIHDPESRGETGIAHGELGVFEASSAGCPGRPNTVVLPKF
jgi:hypothetical protein